MLLSSIHRKQILSKADTKQAEDTAKERGTMRRVMKFCGPMLNPRQRFAIQNPINPEREVVEKIWVVVAAFNRCVEVPHFIKRTRIDKSNKTSTIARMIIYPEIITALVCLQFSP